MFSVILSHPQMGENIGASARAMMNFGLSDLRLVAPRDGWPNERAQAVSAGALEAMPQVPVYDTLPESVADLNFILATTARPRDMVKPVYTPQQAITEIHNRIQGSQKAGIVFGAERTGMLNDEIALCHGIIAIPTSHDFPALNLAQSVLLLGYEWAIREDKENTASKLHTGDSFPAPHGDLENFLSRLENELEHTRFFRTKDLLPTMKRNIRNIFTRADITEQELRTLHGIITALREKS